MHVAYEKPRVTVLSLLFVLELAPVLGVEPVPAPALAGRQGRRIGPESGPGAREKDAGCGPEPGGPAPGIQEDERSQLRCNVAEYTCEH